MNFQIREFRDDDPVTEITALLHRAYKPLADAGMKFVASYQDDERTLRRIKTGRCFLLLHDRNILGLITYYAPDKKRTDWPAIYVEEGSAHFGLFAIEPTLQKHGYGSMLINHIEQFAVAEGNHTLSFDTAENAAHLISYYSKRGFHFAAHHQWADTNYRSVIMKKILKKSSRP
jgi:GNAT superfamily N-acetyltransferase